MGKVIADMSVSLDGFSAGPNVTMENPMGDGGEGLHDWMGSEGGRTGRGGAGDELRLHIVHTLLGGGTALFGGLDPAGVALERIGLSDAEGVTHLSFRVGTDG